MIVSGTHTPGVSAADFGLPPHTALRYELPAQELLRFFPSYTVLDSDAALFTGSGSYVLPGWATIWIALNDGPIGVTIRNKHYGALGAASVRGVTSRAMPVTTRGGVTVVVTINPLGWARFFAASAETMRDRLVPLDEVLLPGGWGADLVALLGASDRGPAVKGLLDRFFLDHLPPPHADEPRIAEITALLADPSRHDLVEAAAGLGISAQAMLRLTKHHFGFPPKMLLMRTRFLRAIVGLILNGRLHGAALLPVGYYDASHFTRDATRFLGMTPRRFLGHDLAYLHAVLRARLLVTGAPARSVAATELIA